MRNFPNYIQLYDKDCGPTCLKIICKHYKLDVSIDNLVKFCETNRQGTSLQNLSLGAQKIGFNSIPVQITLEDLDKVPLPCILLYEQNHFNVLYKIKNDKYYLSDPKVGLNKLNKDDFSKNWLSNSDNDFKKGVCLLLETTPDFYNQTLNSSSKKGININFIKDFIKPQKKLFFQLFLGLFIGIICQLILPFITQNVVDKGIVNKDLSFIFILLTAQLVFYLSYIIVEWMRSKILVYLGSKIKIHLLTSFITKLIGMPISFFDVKASGDILVRLRDQRRIKELLSSSSLEFLFSFFSLIVFSIVLAIYSINLFLIFVVGTIFFFIWFSSFLKKRAYLDQVSFKLDGEDSNNVIDLVNAMQDIKINNAEFKQRSKWEKIQYDIFKNDIDKNTIINRQVLISQVINEIKNIFLIFYAAYLTYQGVFTLGMLLAVVFIISQISLPLNNIIAFIQEFQDASLSFKRLKNISNAYEIEKINNNHKILMNESNDIIVNNLSFRYPGSNHYILKDISFTIKKGTSTAIVGESGSGKTTLLKLLLNFYNIKEGNILYGQTNINDFDDKSLWNNIGVVLQDGKIIKDSIKSNICLSTNEIDVILYEKAIKISNCKKFIDKLPLKDETIIGTSGFSLSGGEKQRILIARAIYKNPHYFYFDEATSSLDTENEKVIVDNINDFIKGKTSITIAHRLSTVINADQIIVLENGKISEFGNHHSLIENKSVYYNLIKNQLELST